MRKTVWVAALMLVAGPVFADQVSYNFTEIGSKHTSVFLNMHNSNTGGESDDKLGKPGSSNPYYALYQVALPPELAGATINSASFSIHENYWTSGDMDNVLLRRLDTPVDWDPGDGTWGGRWSNDNGCGVYFARCTFDNGNVADAYDWAGNHYTWLGTASRLTDHVADIIDNQTVIHGGTTTFDIAPLAQQWADHMADNGTGWANSGFVLWSDDSLYTGMPSIGSPAITIDYTPIPEPATLLLLGSACVVVIRARRRRR